MVYRGRIAISGVYEQAVMTEDAMGSPVELRRIELRLNDPTDDRETIIRLLTYLPGSQFSA